MSAALDARRRQQANDHHDTVLRFGADVSCVLGTEVKRLGQSPIEHVHVTMAPPHFPAELDGLAIGFLTDLHFSRRAPLLPTLLEWASSVSVHMWGIGGDLFETRGGLENVRTLLAALNSPLGTYLVTGNNDTRVFRRWGGAGHAFKQLPVRHLDNECVIAELDGAEIAIAGVDDPSRYRDDLGRALANAGQRTTLLFAHSPDVAHRAARAGVSLVMCGHTHGGQVRLPWVGALFAGTTNPGCGRRMAQGAFAAGDTVVYVSRGIGASILPIRFMCPPEVTTIVLRCGHTTDCGGGAE